MYLVHLPQGFCASVLNSSFIFIMCASIIKKKKSESGFENVGFTNVLNKHSELL